MDEPGNFRSELVLRRGWWRQFVRHSVVLAWSAAAVTLMWAWWWTSGRVPELLIGAVLLTGYCVYAAWTWVRAGRMRLRMLRSGIPTLVLDDLGIRVRHPFGNLDGAYLTWADCVAVVVSRPPTSGRVSIACSAYVEFVPLSPDRVEGEPRPSDQRIELLERTPEQVRTAWVELTGVGRTATEVAQWVVEHRPGVKLVDSLGPHSARTL